MPNETNILACEREEISVESYLDSDQAGDYSVNDISDAHESSSDSFSSDSNISSSSSSNISSSSSSNEEPKDLAQDLRDWIIHHNVDTVKVNSLLRIFKYHGHNELPKDSRTLLKTLRHTSGISKVANGEYWHIGLKIGLKVFLDLHPAYDEDISFATNIDGIPLTESSSTNFWPILVGVFSFKKGIVGDIFPVGVFCGDTKPGSLDEYLDPFIQELLDLNESGFEFGGKNFKCNLYGPFILDTPARSFVKNTKGHTGYYSCDKCTIQGYMVNHNMVFLEDLSEENLSLRTNTSFRNQDNEEHHLRGARSPLEVLDMDLVVQFPLDYMHLVCLGVTKRFLRFWIKKGKFVVRLSSRQINEISSRLNKCRRYIPSEFARKPRSLKHVDRWKATEFRQFLLYTGPVVCNGIVLNDVMDHFRLLQCAIYILASPSFSKTLLDYAAQLLKLYVSSCSDFYGEKFVSLNVHSLTHLAADVKRFGPLDAYSAFPFENHLQFLKKKLRSPNKPLQQLCKRLNEGQKLFAKKSKVVDLLLKQPFLDRSTNIPDNVQSFKKLQTPNYSLTTRSADSCVKLSTGEVIKIKHIYRTNDKEIMLAGSLCKYHDDIFKYPLPSSALGMFVSKISKRVKSYPFNLFEQKCFFSFNENNSIASIIPVLHYQ